ncbi:MAG: (2Fe-2S)-binding protein [Myxococcales bacterium]|nr:(2Fe-2S)-binding protein [Myxococcales bacterium]
MDRENHDTIRFSLDGEAIEARAGDTVAAALLRARITTFTRSIKYHRPRGPFCLSGTCGQCLMRVDGVPSRAACRVRVEEGMTCARQNGPLGVDNDVFRAADFVFGEGLDHHHLLTGSRVLGRVALEIARRLAGLGELPSEVQLPVPGQMRTVRVAVVGAGPAGLAAARAAGADLLIEREPRPGGSAWLRLDLAGPDPDWVAQQARGFTGELMLGADCVGLYPNDSALPGNALLAVRAGPRLVGVVAERVIVATGGASQPLPFPGCDRPGVYAARGLLGLSTLVGEKLVVVGEGEELGLCVTALRRFGYAIERAIDIEKIQPVRALGNPVRGLDTSAGERIRCDAVAIALPPAPLHELASSVGAHARWVAKLHGFAVQVDAGGRTAVPWLFAAGRIAGLSPVSSGEAAGRAAAS